MVLNRRNLLFGALFILLSANGATDFGALAARQSPAWMSTGVVYQVQLRAFTDAGTLAAAAERLPWVRDTGATIVYLTPVTLADDHPDRTMISRRHIASGVPGTRSPYRPKDYYALDPEYGTESDLRAFVAKAHALGLRVMLDAVFAHAGPGAVFAKDHPDWFARTADGRFATAGFSYPRLDFSKPDLRAHLIGSLVKWVREFGVDGYRCDISDEIPLDFWEMARAALERIRPDVALVAEGVRRGNTLKAFDADYNWPVGAVLLPVLWGEKAKGRLCRKLQDVSDKGAEWIRIQEESFVRTSPRGSLFWNYSENHDFANDSFSNRAEKVLGSANQELGLALSFALPGVPFVYNGQEICDASRHCVFAKGFSIDWTKAGSQLARTRRARIRSWVRLRREEPALANSASILWLDNDRPKEVVSFVRRADGARDVEFVGNFSDRALTVSVAGRPRTLAPWGYSFGPVAACPLSVQVAPSAPKAVRIAADELAGYVGRITGRRPPVVAERPETGDVIAVGLPAADMTFDPTFDSYRIRSVPGGLVLAGGNGRSTLYAVYDFLERRGGCRWFWDGDVVPAKGALDLTGLDVYEVSKFEYRGLRYFAHRGLTRFQAEHWGYDDWTREIDWCLKRRLNLFMLRIGTDDLFQRAFPDAVPYPDPTKRLPEALDGFDDRSLFWPLEYRAKLRKRITDYARERGLLQPADFGTMSHWYSRTPYGFLEKFKPDFLPQQGGCYGHPTDRVWDVRQDKWLEAYWKLTDAYLRDYGDDGLLHTIGLGERMCYTNRADNLRMKIDVIHRLVDLAKRKCPADKVLLAGWDFWNTWKSPEVRELVKTLDPSRVVIWDYEADQTRPGNGDFSEWDVCRRFPYAFGIFLAYESGLDIRADYATIERRQRLIEGDPMCKAYLLWPESSHTDTFALRYFTANAWRADRGDHRKLLPAFCRDRYGDEDAAAFESVWRAVLPFAATSGWGSNYANRREYWEAGAVVADGEINRPTLWTGRHEADLTTLAAVPAALRALAQIPLRSEAARRDAFDLARTAVDRLISMTRRDFSRRWCDYLAGAAETARLTDEVRAYAALGVGMARLLALHTDYSLWDSLQRLNAVEPIRYPDFEHTLAANAGNDYCRSHMAEFAQHWYAPCMKDLADALLGKIAAGDRTPLDVKPLAERSQALRRRCFAAKLADLAPCLPRTDENFAAVLEELAASADLALGSKKEKAR